MFDLGTRVHWRPKKAFLNIFRILKDSRKKNTNQSPRFQQVQKLCINLDNNSYKHAFDNKTLN